MSRFAQDPAIRTGHSNFVALMPVRWNPDSPGTRQVLVFSSREDRNHFKGESEVAQIKRIRRETIKHGMKWKFFGGNEDHKADPTYFHNGCREFLQEAHILIDPDALAARVDNGVGFVHRELVSATHTKIFVGFNANDWWRGWKTTVRKSFKIEKPGPHEQHRCDEILGMPVWKDIEFLLSTSAQMQSSHLIALRKFDAWLRGESVD